MKKWRVTTIDTNRYVRVVEADSYDKALEIVAGIPGKTYHNEDSWGEHQDGATEFDAEEVT